MNNRYPIGMPKMRLRLNGGHCEPWHTPESDAETKAVERGENEIGCQI